MQRLVDFGLINVYERKLVMMMMMMMMHSATGSLLQISQPHTPSHRQRLAQILCARLRILANPAGRGLIPPHERPSPEEAPLMAPDVLKGVWRYDPPQRSMLPRIRCRCVLRADLDI